MTDKSNSQNLNAIDVRELNDLQKNKVDFLLLDVRDPFEYEICNLGGKLIPLKTLPNKLSELDKNQYIVVHCKCGVRSQQAAEYLRAQGFKKVHNLTGGIMEWIEKINPSLKKY